MKNEWNIFCDRVEYMRPGLMRNWFIAACSEAKVFSFAGVDRRKAEEKCGWYETNPENFTCPLPFHVTGFIFEECAAIAVKIEDDNPFSRYWVLASISGSEIKGGGLMISTVADLYTGTGELVFEFMDMFWGKEERLNFKREEGIDKAMVGILSMIVLGNAYINQPDYMIIESKPKKKRECHRKIRRVHERPEFIALHRTAVRDSWARATGNGAAKCPHMRRGHFKTLRAERWGPEKRGTRVWVRPCTIHGEEIAWTEKNRMYTVR